MYIDGASKLAYADVLPTDEDFPSIQGLAEAGLISSQLLWEDTLEADSSSHFAPESPLTRQDLLTWRMALEREPFLQTGNSALPTKMDVQNLSGFLDIDKIQQDAWPALLADVKSGERSIVALAFGYTRRFQPEKPVTKGQAAVALATGQAWEFVSEELARQEAESMAEAAVVAELGLETQGQQEETADFNEFIEKGILKQHGSSIVSGGLQAQLEQVKAEHEEKLALLKEHAELECTKDLLTKMKHDVEEEVRILSSAKLEVSFQKGQVDKLHAEAQEEKEKISKIRSELEVEKKALYLARVWAEEEARRASAHSKLLEQARKRWELGGIKVRVAEELSDANIPGPSWKYSEHLHGQVRFPVQWLAQKSNDSIKALRDALLRFFHLVVLFCQAIQQRSTEFTIGVGNRISGVKTKCSDSVTSTLDGIKQVMPSVTQLATSIKECTSRSIAECKGGAERLVERFKVA
ncbi:hypothetical protein KP509_1Z000300 [Ceratopteris richardii]|nr:hypothetical protein KP509_1Z000300 [Ceratopteris richardii]